MATGLEGVAGAATLVSVIGFSVQVFDGCVKGFNLLSSAQNLGRDADMFRCMLDWEQFRLEQWAERVDLFDPEKADPSLNWQLVNETLEHISNLTNDSDLLKKKYNLSLVDIPAYTSRASTEKADKAPSKPFSPFRKLFSNVDNTSSAAAAKVIQARNNPMKKLWWAAVDKQGLRQLIEDISRFTRRLYDVLHASTQDQMKASIDSMISMATARSENVLELAIMRQLARLPDIIQSGTRKPEEIEADVERSTRSLFFCATRKGEIKKVGSLLDEGLDIETEDQMGWAAMIQAAEYGQLPIVELLLRRGANPLHGTIGHRLPLHFAAEGGHLGIVKALLSRDQSQLNARDHLGQTPLHKAARESREDVAVFLLLQEGIEADPEDNDGWRPLMNAISRGNAKIVRMIFAHSDVDPNYKLKNQGQTPLWMAITKADDCAILRSLLERSDLDLTRTSRWGEGCVYRAACWSKHAALQLLLDRGADINLPNEEGRTPLSIAASKGNKEGIKILLKQPNIAIDQADQTKKTPLMYAAEAAQTQCVKLLLAHKPVLEARDTRGRTTLSLAAIKGHKIPMKLLLKAGALVNTQDTKGNTPLALAAEHKQDVIVRLLLENGADADLADDDEETPFEKARDRKLEDVIKVFKEVLKLP